MPFFFFFSPNALEQTVVRESMFLIVHTDLTWISWSEILNKSDIPALNGGTQKRWEVRNPRYNSQPAYRFI